MAVRQETSERDEIADIMAEINSLQRGMAEAPLKGLSASPEPAAEEPPMDSSEPEPEADPVPEAEAELEAEAEAAPPAPEDESGLDEFRAEGASSSDGLEDTLATLKEEAPAPHSILSTVTVTPPAPAPAKAAAPTPPTRIQREKKQTRENPMQDHDEGSLTMSVNGTMTLKLKYEFEGHEVTIRFADHCLKVELADGTEFKIPVRASRQAA